MSWLVIKWLPSCWMKPVITNIDSVITQDRYNSTDGIDVLTANMPTINSVWSWWLFPIINCEANAIIWDERPFGCCLIATFNMRCAKDLNQLLKAGINVTLQRSTRAISWHERGGGCRGHGGKGKAKWNQMLHFSELNQRHANKQWRVL